MQSEDNGVQQSVSQTVMVLVGRDLGYNVREREEMRAMGVGLCIDAKQTSSLSILYNRIPHSG